MPDEPMTLEQLASGIAEAKQVVATTLDVLHKTAGVVESTIAVLNVTEEAVRSAPPSQAAEPARPLTALEREEREELAQLREALPRARKKAAEVDAAKEAANEAVRQAEEHQRHLVEAIKRVDEAEEKAEASEGARRAAESERDRMANELERYNQKKDDLVRRGAVTRAVLELVLAAEPAAELIKAIESSEPVGDTIPETARRMASERHDLLQLTQWMIGNTLRL